MPPKQKITKHKSISQSSSSSIRLLYYLFASILVLVIALFYSRSHSRTQPIITDWGFNVTKNVTRWKWDPSRPFADEVFALNEPVILENSFVESWKAKNWTPEYLSQYIPKLSNVKQHKNPIITYYEENTMLEHSPIQWRKSHHDIVLMDTKAFFEKAAHDTSAYYYFSNEFRDMDQHFLRNHRSLMDELEPSSFLSLNGKPPEYVGLWMGGRGVTASMHYDVSDNVFVQLYGHKQFIFWPPTAYKELLVYPRLSPNHRQSQIDFSQPDYLSKYPQLKSLPAYEATLGPGDVLFFPAFWFHHVTSLDLCISVNAWSQSRDWKIIETQLFKATLPLNPADKQRTKMLTEILQKAGFEDTITHTKIIFRLFIEQFVSALYAEDNITVARFMADLYATRYASLVNEEAAFMQLGTNLCSPVVDQVTAQHLLQQLQPLSANIVQIFGKISTPSVRDMHVESYVEGLMDFDVLLTGRFGWDNN